MWCIFCRMWWLGEKARDRYQQENQRLLIHSKKVQQHSVRVVNGNKEKKDLTALQRCVRRCFGRPKSELSTVFPLELGDLGNSVLYRSFVKMEGDNRDPKSMRNTPCLATRTSPWPNDLYGLRSSATFLAGFDVRNLFDEVPLKLLINLI